MSKETEAWKNAASLEKDKEFSMAGTCNVRTMETGQAMRLGEEGESDRDRSLKPP